MARKKNVCIGDSQTYAICVTYPNQSVGWLIGGGKNGLDVKTYPSKEAAEKAMEQMKKNPHYSWNLPMEVREFF